MAPVGGQTFQHHAGRLGKIDAADQAMDRLADEALDCRIFDKIERPRRHLDQVVAQARGVLRQHQPVGGDLGRIVAADQRDDRLRVEEFFAHEQGQVVGDLDFVFRDDLGVARDERDRDAPEQRHHREPVGQRADHGRFGERPQQADRPAGRQEQRDDEQQRRHAEQAQCQHFCAA